jgi:uncharacterized membrane protein
MGIGAASGALGGSLTDVGINDQFMKDAASALGPGTAGLFLLVRKMTTDKVLADLEGVGGTVMRTSFDETKEAALREALAGHAKAAEAKPAAASSRRGNGSGTQRAHSPFNLRLQKSKSSL